MKYRGEIDGLRTLAVLPVILFHSGYSMFSGGYVGVDVFFVISGYLITTILISELNDGNFSIVRFYERRARRILPALFFVMLISILFAWTFLNPFELISFSKSVSAVSLFVSNIFFWRDGGYFETAAELKPLLHTWSLAVEEQYYIFFPVFLLLIWNFGRYAVLKIIVSLAILSLLAAQIFSVYKPVPNFFLLPSRGWELALGAIAAFIWAENKQSRVKSSTKQFLSSTGLVLILISVFTFGNSTPSPSLYTLAPTIGAMLVILYADVNTITYTILRSPPFVGVGLISYSAYLWHQPVLAFARLGAPVIGEISRAVLLLIIFALSVFSWKYIETPFRKTVLFGRGFIFSFAISGTIFFALLGVASYKAIPNMKIEKVMAKELVSSYSIYASNMNERTFIKSRIEIETLRPNYIVLGSSRVMQINSKIIDGELLNLSVSGASVEDDVAIWGMASKKFNPNFVLIGADPWLFNAKSTQDRWRTLEVEYESALAAMGLRSLNLSTTKDIGESELNNSLSALYRHVNISKISATNDLPERMDKIRRDGSRVYNLVQANKSQSEVEADAVSFASYAMRPYEYSNEAEDTFRHLVNHIGKRHKVIIVLSPYHPKLYSYIIKKDLKFIEIENSFRRLGADLGVRVIGSYDPAQDGCTSDEFYDGMHPKVSCIEKVLLPLK